MGQTLTNLLDRFDFWRLKSTVTDNERSGVLLVSSGGIGDTILFRLIVLRFRTLLKTNETFHLIVRTESQHVKFLYPRDVQFHPIDYQKFLKNRKYRRKECKRLHGLNLRIAMSTDHLRHPLIDDVIIRATQAQHKYAMYPRGWPKYDGLLKRNTKQYDTLIRVPDYMEHRLIRWWHLANEVCGDEQPVPAVTLPKSELPLPAKPGRDLFMIHPFSAVKERQYSVKMFQSIIEALPDNCDIALSSGPDDLLKNPEYKVLLNDPRVYADLTSLEEKASTLQTVKIVISIDSSVMHLATMCGAPTICLASAAHVIDSIPYDPRMTPNNVSFLYHDMECRMCLGQCSQPLEDDRYPCIARMESRLIVNKIKDILGSQGI